MNKNILTIIFKFLKRNYLVIIILLLINAVAIFLLNKIAESSEINHAFTLPEMVTVGGIISGMVLTFAQIQKVASQTEKRKIQESNKYTIEMMKEWNSNSLEATRKVLREFDSKFKECDCIPYKILKEKFTNNTSNLEQAIIRIFNYFEYVASAYYNCANKDIILNSFAVSMFKYYILLEDYLITHIKNNHRNPWKPFTEFLQDIIDNRKLAHKGALCAICLAESTPCHIRKNSNLHKRLKLVNTVSISKDKFEEKLIELPFEKIIQNSTK